MIAVIIMNLHMVTGEKTNGLLLANYTYRNRDACFAVVAAVYHFYHKVFFFLFKTVFMNRNAYFNRVKYIKIYISKKFE